MQKLLVLLVMVVAHAWAHGHAHDHHGHSHDEPPAFKWSRQANLPEDEILEEDIETIVGHGHVHEHAGAHGHSHDHVPSHDHGHSHGGHGRSHGGHGHSHGGHGHSHGGHGHSHGGHGHSHGGKAREPAPEEREKMRQNLHAQWDDDEDHAPLPVSSVWIQAMGATLLISAAPFFILFFIPLDNSQEKQWLLKILLAFASGGLLGDALLHLIPHAQMAVAESGHGHGHSHAHGEEGHVHDMSVGLGVLSGIVSFLCVEKFVRIIKGGHGHSHGPASAPAAAKEKEAAKKKPEEETEKTTEDKDTKENAKIADKKQEGEEKKKKKEVEKKAEEVVEEIKVAGYLNLAADCFHNFTDGLAIGASFLAGESIGVITTFTILLHEVPHEIGDFAILIQSGVPKSKAIFLQLLTAVGALTGCAVSLMLDGVTDTASQLTLPFTAGGFIYIATVSVLPELLEGSTLRQSLMEVAALLLGILMMVIIAQFE